MQWGNLNDEEKVEFAKQEYAEAYLIGDPVLLKTKNTGRKNVGYVSKAIHDPITSLDAYVVTDVQLPKNPSPSQLQSVKQVAILYQGSKQLYGDWYGADSSIAMQTPLLGIPQSMQAVTVMQDSLKDYPQADLYVYAHSLGAANATNALGCLQGKQQERLVEANLYEGPAVWHLLNYAQQKNLGQLKSKILNHMDLKDLISVSGYSPYTDPDKVAGILIYVDSPNLHDVGQQHMWGGYRYDEQGNLLLDEQLMKTASKQLAVRHRQAYLLARAKGGTVALEYEAATRYCDFLGRQITQLKELKKINSQIESTLVKDHSETKRRMYGIPNINAEDIEHCDDTYRLKPQYHYSPTAVLTSQRELDGGIQAFINLKNKILNTADQRVLQDQQDRQQFCLTE
ncbi:hypothetical protein [Convivina praedatoris]|uniref:DUF2974 domain-containing protein n=1 Tax=Convivina praedatoris TaxID=2880963 RepID=A0ABN8HF77_9LACO|nr:hypothetical protein [Convivina sp. LMG 32447]CAH1856909.1 hypothetical protein R077815_01494 [Convivina sp. LMG 32447]CAH1857182.1 hypothetical protein R078138_01526 [Convivina sp. LMG 32447]CAH1857411.1 hypothetical protein LMG032447_01526 [Convivina sp. LMG 32447]